MHQALYALLPDGPRLRYVNDLATHGEALFATACDVQQEGIVAKLADSPYKAGRQPAWRKIKNRRFPRQEALGWHELAKSLDETICLQVMPHWCAVLVLIHNSYCALG